MTLLFVRGKWGEGAAISAVGQLSFLEIIARLVILNFLQTA